MKTGRWVRGICAVAAISAAAALSGCSGFWNPPASTSTSTPTTTASGIFYVLNQKTSQIAGFSYAAAATAPTAVSSSPFALGATPLAMALAPSGSYLYVSTAAGIYVYAINSGGSLTIANQGQPISTDTASAMQVDPTGAWLVEEASGSGGLSAIPLDADTGILPTSGNTSVQTIALPSTNIEQIAISPTSSTTSGSYVFVAMGATSTSNGASILGGTAVVPFTAGNSNPFGTVSRIAPKSSLGGDNAVAVDPSNRLLYVGETVAVSGTQTGGLRVFTIGTSSINEISGSPFATGGTGPSAILPTTSYVYVANSAVSGSSSGNVTGFSLGTSGTTTVTYSLSTINTVTAGVNPSSLAEDSTGSYLLVTNYGGSPDLSAFTFDTTTAGQLDAGPTAATGTDPTGAWQVVAGQ